MTERIEEWLVVDGYNVIGSQVSFDQHSKGLEEQRNRLIHDLSEYQAITGRQVYIVFDAHRAFGAMVQTEIERVRVIYTRKDETADEFIERFVRTHQSPDRRIYVATSDYLEQRMVFGQGAYRISSRELLEEVRHAQTRLSQKLRNQPQKRQSKLRDRLTDDLRAILERWRRND